MRNWDRYKPAVSRNLLFFFAGFVWECVGAVLLGLAFSWLSETPDSGKYLFGGVGIVLALLIHHFGFLRIVDKNLKRIFKSNDKRCMFGFIPWKSYLIIAVMIALGTILRHSVIPKQYLAILYVGIGLALMLSGVRYLRIFIRETRNSSA